MLPFDVALQRLLSLVPAGATPAPSQLVELADADGRVLAEDLRAPEDIPATDYSAMDGYAVRLANFTGSPPTSLPIRGESRAGAVPEAHVDGTAMRILTGATVPPGADAVVAQENVHRDGATATFAAAPRKGQHIRRRGEDLQRGAIAVPRGTRLRPPHLALAASLDRPSVQVTRQPVVTILSTGDEIRLPGSVKTPGSIPVSISVALAAMVQRAGGTIRARRIVPDDRARTERAFADALADVDLLITVGGVSVGDHDLVRPALEAVGVKLEFWRVAIKPGKPLAVGTFARAGVDGGVTLVLGLPGNPASALVTFSLFGAPLLRALARDRAPLPVAARAHMTRGYAREPGRREFVRAFVERSTSDVDVLIVTPLTNQASGATTSMARANALVCLAENVGAIRAGDEVDVFFLSELGT